MISVRLVRLLALDDEVELEPDDRRSIAHAEAVARYRSSHPFRIIEANASYYERHRSEILRSKKLAMNGHSRARLLELHREANQRWTERDKTPAAKGGHVMLYPESGRARSARAAAAARWNERASVNTSNTERSTGASGGTRRSAVTQPRAPAHARLPKPSNHPWKKEWR